MIIRKENKRPTVPLSRAKENTDKNNKLQLQEIKKCKETHTSIYCWA